MTFARIPALLLVLAGIGPCGGGGGPIPVTTGDTAPPVTGDLQWYLGCGDPVCSGYGGPFDGVPLCSDEGVSVGGSCDQYNATCDPVDGCNALVVCSDEDPTMQPGGCPISRKAHKKQIDYLSDAERRAAADQLLQMPLATWRYTWEGDEETIHLGFLIDDVEGSAAVRPDGDHVDLYGYTSLAVAAIQAQQAELDAMRAELEALKASCAER